MVEENGTPREYIKSRAELASPDTDWETSWRRARLKGLGTEATSFLWKTMHNILPTEQRLARILPNSSQNCKYCPTPTPANLLHCFFECVNTREAGSWLLAMLQQQDPSLSASGLLKLEFQADESQEMPLVWLAAQTLLYTWGIRASGKVVNLLTTRSVLESKINLLRETRYTIEHQLITQIFMNS